MSEDEGSDNDDQMSEHEYYGDEEEMFFPRYHEPLAPAKPFLMPTFDDQVVEILPSEKKNRKIQWDDKILVQEIENRFAPCYADDYDDEGGEDTYEIEIVEDDGDADFYLEIVDGEVFYVFETEDDMSVDSEYEDDDEGGEHDPMAMLAEASRQSTLNAILPPGLDADSVMDLNYTPETQIGEVDDMEEFSAADDGAKELNGEIDTSEQSTCVEPDLDSAPESMQVTEEELVESGSAGEIMLTESETPQSQSVGSLCEPAPVSVEPLPLTTPLEEVASKYDEPSDQTQISTQLVKDLTEALLSDPEVSSGHVRHTDENSAVAKSEMNNQKVDLSELPAPSMKNDETPVSPVPMSDMHDSEAPLTPVNHEKRRFGGDMTPLASPIAPASPSPSKSPMRSILRANPESPKKPPRAKRSNKNKGEKKITKTYVRADHYDGEHRVYSWEKPSWTQKQLRSTGKGEELRQSGNLANPITFPKKNPANADLLVDEKGQMDKEELLRRIQGGEMPIPMLPGAGYNRFQRKLKFSMAGTKIRDGGDIVKPITKATVIRSSHNINQIANPGVLKKTHFGEKAKKGENLAAPVTLATVIKTPDADINHLANKTVLKNTGVQPVEKKAYQWEKPSWASQTRLNPTKPDRSDVSVDSLDEDDADEPKPRAGFLRSTRTGKLLRTGSDPLDISGHEEIKKKYEWEKPSWVNARLGSTKKGIAAKSGDSLSRPITQLPDLSKERVQMTTEKEEDEDRP